MTLKSYISVTFQMEVWCFLTRSIMLAVFSPIAHARLMQSITINQFLSRDTRLSLLTYSYPLCPISLVGSQKSPVPYPILNRAQPSFSYLHLFLCFTSIPHYVAKLPCWAEQIGKKKLHCSCCGHWVMKGGCDSAKKPLKVGEDREDEIPI